MLKLFRKKRTYKDITVRVEDLQVNDRCVYDNVDVEIKELVPEPDYASTQVTFAPIKPGAPWYGQWRTVSLHDIQFVSVDRPTR